MRCYFEIYDDGGVTVDENGAEVENIDEATDTAAALLVDLARDALGARTVCTLACSVRDRDGAVVHRAELILRAC